MTAETIDHGTLSKLVQKRTIKAAQVVGRPGGWGVLVEDSTGERQLTATRSGEVRVFKRLETLVGYLQGVGIQRFEVDAANYDPTSVSTYQRPDASEALKRAHSAAAHDQWFRDQVRQGVEEADDPKTKWVTNDQAKSQAAKRRAAWRKSAA
jgi:hypothetical protein